VVVNKATVIAVFLGLGLSFGLILCVLAQVLRGLRTVREQRGRSAKLDVGFVLVLWLAALPLLVLASFGRMYMERDLVHELGPLVSIASAAGLVVFVNRFVSPRRQQFRT
jgi:hypothetical protein